jgi:hypothetical protein
MMNISSPPPSLITTPRRSPRHTPAASTLPVAALQLPSARTVEEIINDQSLYVDRALFFNLLQDMGTPMSEGDVTTHDPSLAKPKRKAKHISYKDPNHDYRFYSALYNLSVHVWDILSSHRIDFPQLPKGGTNKSTYLHDIGKIIASQRKEYALADVHGIGDLGEESIDDLIMAIDKPSTTDNEVIMMNY